MANKTYYGMITISVVIVYLLVVKTYSGISLFFHENMLDQS